MFDQKQILSDWLANLDYFSERMLKLTKGEPSADFATLIRKTYYASDTVLVDRPDSNKAGLYVGLDLATTLVGKTHQDLTPEDGDKVDRFLLANISTNTCFSAAMKTDVTLLLKECADEKYQLIDTPTFVGKLRKYEQAVAARRSKLGLH